MIGHSKVSHHVVAHWKAGIPIYYWLWSLHKKVRLFVSCDSSFFFVFEMS